MKVTLKLIPEASFGFFIGTTIDYKKQNKYHFIKKNKRLQAISHNISCCFYFIKMTK